MKEIVVNIIIEQMPDFEELLQSKSNDSAFRLCNQYIEMVMCYCNLSELSMMEFGICILLCCTFKEMLEWAAAYDRTINYFRLGLVYYIDIIDLENTGNSIYIEFMNGNFVVKETDGQFNQVHTDQGIEHVNKLCSLSGRLIGIPPQQSALVQWMQ